MAVRMVIVLRKISAGKDMEELCPWCTAWRNRKDAFAMENSAEVIAQVKTRTTM